MKSPATTRPRGEPANAPVQYFLATETGKRQTFFLKKVCRFSNLIARKLWKERHKTQYNDNENKKTKNKTARAVRGPHRLRSYGVRGGAKPIADWPRLRRRFTLALAANTSPTGCVQVAFGRDLNGDECLEPEETELVVGNDCGAWFVRDELTGREESDPRPPSGGQPSSRTFALVQSKALERRWNMAKVTTRGRADSNASLLAEWLEPFALILK